MSFVGPRPLLVKYKDRLVQFRTGAMKFAPGISGLAQIKGRNALSWDKKFEYDIYYVDHFNLLMDLKILFITLFQVLRGQGVSPSEQGIMPEFMEKDNVDKTSNIS